MYFQSLLSNSLKELPWLSSQTSHDFFPRCYVLNGDEGELGDVLGKSEAPMKPNFYSASFPSFIGLLNNTEKE